MNCSLRSEDHRHRIALIAAVFLDCSERHVPWPVRQVKDIDTREQTRLAGQLGRVGPVRGIARGRIQPQHCRLIGQLDNLEGDHAFSLCDFSSYYSS